MPPRETGLQYKLPFGENMTFCMHVPKLGIWDEICGKPIRVISERVGAVVARGDVKVGFQQINEILPIDGIDYAGPLPDAIQKITIFSTGLKRGGNKMLVQRLINYLLATDKIELIDTTGLDPVAKDLFGKFGIGGGTWTPDTRIQISLPKIVFNKVMVQIIILHLAT